MALVALVLAKLARETDGIPISQDVLLSSWFALGVGLASGAVYLVGVLLSLRMRMSGWVVAMMIVVALGMRAPIWATDYEKVRDYCRYMWDGAMLANGIDPYAHAPQDVIDGRVDDERINALAAQAPEVLDGITYKHLRTIYPPVAQATFAAGYLIKPFDLTAWRIVLLLLDALTAWAVLALIRHCKLPLGAWTVWLWNPLLVWEVYLGGHIDIAAAAFVTVFVLALVTKRPVIAAVFLALAAGVKLYPMVLVFFLFQHQSRRRSLIAACVFAIVLGGVMLPYLGALGDSDTSGLATYARKWEWRGGVHHLFDWIGWGVRHVLSLQLDGRFISRGITVALLAAASAWLGLRRTADPHILCGRVGTVILLMLLLGSTLWPWYYLPVIALAATAARRASLLAWTMLLPLAYVPIGVLPEWVLVCGLHVPIWMILGFEWWPRRIAARKVLGGDV